MDTTSIPFEYFAGQFVSLPARLDDTTPARLLFDTGSGLTTISETLLTRLGRHPTASPHNGRRMSGQELSIPMAKLGSLSLGSHRKENIAVGSFDMSALSSGGQTMDGILSLGYFDGTPVTEDHRARRLTIETDASMRRRSAEGTEIGVEVEREGPSVAMFTNLRLPSGATARVEVDTGSWNLILNERFMAELGVQKGGPGVRVREGEDETGHRFVRYGARLSGEVALEGAPGFREPNPEVIFQDIIYDGLVGHAFLRRYVVTYDVPRSRIVLARPG